MIITICIVGYIFVAMTVFRWGWVEVEHAIQEQRPARGMHFTCDSSGKYRESINGPKTVRRCDCPWLVISGLLWPAVPFAYLAFGLAKVADKFLRPKVKPKGLEAKIRELEKELGMCDD